MTLRAVILGAALAGCTSTLALESQKRTEDDAGVADAASGDDATTSTPDGGKPKPEAGSDPLAGLPELRVSAPGTTPAVHTFALTLGPTTPKVVGPPAGDTWPCGDSLVVDSSARVASYDFALVNDNDVAATVFLSLAGPVDDEALHRRDVALAVYLESDFPADRRQCTGVMAVDCSTCGDPAEAPVGLGRLPAFVMPAKSRYPASVFALAEGRYGQLLLVAAVPP